MIAFGKVAWLEAGEVTMQTHPPPLQKAKRQNRKHVFHIRELLIVSERNVENTGLGRTRTLILPALH